MTLTVRIDEETRARLDALAEETGRTKAYYVRQLLKEHLEDLEDYYLGMASLERVRAGERTYSMEEIKADLGLED